MKEYKTKDFYLSALLYCNGFKLISSEKHSKNTVFFIFKNHDEELLTKILSDFINMTAIANVKKFTRSINEVRNELNKYR